MEQLILPDSGPVYLDSSGFIYSVERVEPYRALLAPMWRQWQVRQFKTFCSDLVVLETLVKPFRDNDVVVEGVFRSLFDSNEVMLIPTTQSLWEEAARLRAETGLKTPDALHAAAALRADCTLFITNDRDFRRVQGLPVAILDDFMG